MNQTVNIARVLLRTAAKINRAVDRVGFLPAIGTQVVVRCNGIVCRERGRYYVETGIVGIELPKFGSDHLPARLAGLWVN